MNIREAYEESLQREGHVKDPAQLAVIARFEDLQTRLLDVKPARRGLVGWFGRRTPTSMMIQCNRPAPRCGSPCRCNCQGRVIDRVPAGMA